MYSSARRRNREASDFVALYTHDDDARPEHTFACKRFRGGHDYDGCSDDRLVQEEPEVEVGGERDASRKDEKNFEEPFGVTMLFRSPFAS